MHGHVWTGVATFASFMAGVLYMERDSKWLWWQAVVFAGVILIGKGSFYFKLWSDLGFGTGGRNVSRCQLDCYIRAICCMPDRRETDVTNEYLRVWKIAIIYTLTVYRWAQSTDPSPFHLPPRLPPCFV